MNGPSVCDGRLNQAHERELRRGAGFKRENETGDLVAATFSARQARLSRGLELDGDGGLVARVYLAAQADWFLLFQQPGVRVGGNSSRFASQLTQAALGHVYSISVPIEHRVGQ